MTGAARAAKAAPDGYTVLLSGSAVLAQNPALYKRQLYNPVTDFEHVALHTNSARVLIARKDFPANTFAEFVAYAKANQTSCNTARPASAPAPTSAPSCSTGAWATKITHVPYRGAGPAMQDLIAGRLDYMPEQISTAMPQIQGGTVKASPRSAPSRAPGLENAADRRRSSA